MLVVHPHLHRRRTGVTSHVEAIVRELGKSVDARVFEIGVFGRVVDAKLPRVGLRELRRTPAIWHAHRNVELVVGLVLRAFGARLKIVGTRHAATAPSRLTRWLLGRSDRVVALTAEMARALPMRSEVVGHGVDLARFSPPDDRDEAWRALGHGGRLGIGVVGRVRPAKGQGDFIAAFEVSSKEFPDGRAVLVGAARGSDRAWAEGLARRSDAIVLSGEQSDVARFLRGFTVVVQPSRSEGYSLALVEAMACGCCVVAARLAHYAALVDEGRTGFFYEPGDVDGLREKLEPLLREPARAREVGAAAAKVARERFGIDREAASLVALYRKLA